MEELISSAMNYKAELFKQLSKIGKCISSDKRIEILHLLIQGPKTVERLAQDTGMNVANVSRHLQILNDSRLVTYNKKGNYVIYSLADPSVADFLYSLWSIGDSRLTDMSRIKEEFYDEMEGLYTLTKDEVYKKVKNGNVVLIDIRPKEEYDAGHIEGALSLPLENLDDYLQELPKDKEIIAYCRGRYCVFSAIAAQKLKNKGFMAYHMEESLYEWQTYLEHRHESS